MDEEIKTQANDELAQALASVSDDTVADSGSPRVAASSTTDDDFSDFMQSEDRVYNQSPVAQRDGSKSFAEPQSRRAAYVEPAQISTLNQLSSSHPMLIQYLPLDWKILKKGPCKNLGL